MPPARSGRSASGTVAWSASATYTARLAASSANARGVYRNRTLDWLNASPKRSTMRMRSELLAIATKPSGHWSEQKPAMQRHIMVITGSWHPPVRTLTLLKMRGYSR